MYWNFAYEEFETSKAFVLVAFGCFAAPQINWRKAMTNRLATWFAVFTLSAAVSAFFSIDQHMSIFGNYKCRAGFLVIASCLVFYLAASEHLRNPLREHQVVDLVLLCSAIVAIYAIAQVMGYDFKKWTNTLVSNGYTRPISTFGHPNFMANYLAMTLPFALWRMSYSRTWRRFFMYASLVMASIAAIWFSLSRGMCIAAFCGVLTYFFYKKVKPKEAFVFFCAATAIALITLAALPVFRTTATSRMASLLYPGPARIEYPKTAFEIWKHYPWIGVGTDAFEIGFQNQRSVRYWQVEPGGLPHKAHNDFLNVLATQGLFGGLAAIMFTITLVGRIRKSRSAYTAPAVSAIVVFYVAGLTSFAVIGTTILFLLCVVLLEVGGIWFE